MNPKYLVIISFITLAFAALAFTSVFTPPVPEADSARAQFLENMQRFKKEAVHFRDVLSSGNEKKIQFQFLKLRDAYKRTEWFLEYWYPFYAEKLNSPPIPYYEEAEADMPIQYPSGMQLIESWVFPHLHITEKDNLELQAVEMVRYAIEIPQVTESHTINDNNIFDAVMEELYRISALTITGFDSQLAANSLPECSSALNSIHQLLLLYKKSINLTTTGTFEKMNQLLTGANKYLAAHRDFNAFNRMDFIRLYLDPITKEIGKYKIAKNYTDNPSGEFYSSIRKNSSLFSPGIFNPYRFLDDYNSSSLKIEMGRRLFFEKQLSSNGQRSCGTCHDPSKAFTDGLRTSLALDGHSALPRNAPTIWNAALQRNLFVDSRSRNLEDQVMQVLNNVKEMHGSAKETADKIITSEAYRSLYENAYPGAAPEKAAENICNAIASYERTLIALNSRFDKHMRGKNSLSKNEINGFNLFMGKAKCGTCHFMPLFGGAKPPRYYYLESEVLGVPADVAEKPAKLDGDSGRFLVTRSPVHLFSFKTPSIRNSALTAPYMHNGVFHTLEEVVDFYDHGGGKGLHIAPGNQTLPFDSLHLTKLEKANLVLFIKSLTDTSSSY